jgi:hypothetical protein
MEITRLDKPSHEEMIFQSAMGYVDVLTMYADGCKKKNERVPVRINEAISGLKSRLALSAEDDPGRRKLDFFIENVVMPLSKDMQSNNPSFVDGADPNYWV